MWPREDDDATFVRWMFESPELCADAFDSRFLAAAPLPRIMELRDSLLANMGGLSEVEIEGGDGRAHFERGVLPVQITRDANGRVAGLFFRAPESVSATVQEAGAAIAALPGSVALLITRDAETLYAHDADSPLAVGSAFKLAVLAAVQRAVESGRGPWRAGWSRVVQLEERWRSLPSGRLQAWEVGTPITVATLAAMMISESDNTATDALIALVGREAVEAEAPARVRPFLTTRELFTIKDPAHADRLARFRAGDEAARRALVASLEGAALPPVASFAAQAPSPDVEWHFTPRELCALLDRTHALPAMRINPGVASPETWREVAFKGGSEAGVLSLSTRVEDAEGHAYCVSAIWNGDGDVALEQLAPLYLTALGALRSGG